MDRCGRLVRRRNSRYASLRRFYGGVPLGLYIGSERSPRQTSYYMGKKLCNRDRRISYYQTPTAFERPQMYNSLQHQRRDLPRRDTHTPTYRYTQIGNQTLSSRTRICRERAQFCPTLPCQSGLEQPISLTPKKNAKNSRFYYFWGR